MNNDDALYHLINDICNSVQIIFSSSNNNHFFLCSNKWNGYVFIHNVITYSNEIRLLMTLVLNIVIQFSRVSEYTVSHLIIFNWIILNQCINYNWDERKNDVPKLLHNNTMPVGECTWDSD